MVETKFNLGLTGKIKYSWNDILHNYLLDPGKIIGASGRTNKYWNALGGCLTGAFLKEGYDQAIPYLPAVGPKGATGSNGGNKINM